MSTYGLTIQGHSYRQQLPLTDNQLRQLAPSAFATQPHDSRSSRYTYIPTSDVVTALTHAGFQPFSAIQGATRDQSKNEYTKHMIRFRHPDYNLEPKVGDTVPEVVLINSHDGSTAYKLMAGLWRLICANGLMVCDSTIDSLSVMHKGDITSQVIEASFQLVQQAEASLERIADWNSIPLTVTEQITFAETAHTYRFADEQGEIHSPIAPAQLLIPRRSQDQHPSEHRLPRPDLWHTFNVIQENTIKGGLTGTKSITDPETHRVTRRRVRTRQIHGIDQNVRLNKALWSISERIAQLKTPVAA